MATTHVPLKGGAYQSHSVIAAAQRCLNLYPETGPTSTTSSGGSASTIGEPSVVTHYPTPGTRLLGTIGTGPIRGIRQCSTGGVYVVSGDTLYSVDVSNWTGTPLGTLTPGMRTPVSMTDNGLDMVVVDGSANGWTVTLATNAFAQINDPNGMFIGADRADYLDTFFIFNKPGTPQFYISGSLAVTFDSLDFANKAAYSDLLMTTVVCKRLIYLVGERTTEIWYESGETFSTTAGQSASVGEATAVVAFQFAPMQSEVFVDHGTIAKYSPAVYDNYMFWLTRDRQGHGAVHAIAGYESKRVSTFAIEQEIAGYDRLWDAIGFCYRLGGHAFYVLTFPHADKTWAYDIITGLWHEWGWIDSNGGEHRHRANCYCAVNDLGVVGDWQNGNVYALDHRLFTDNGRPIKRVRAFPHLLSDGKRVFYRQFLADLETGWAPEMLGGTETRLNAPFTAPDGTNLSAYTSEVGGGWAAIGAATAQIAGQRVVGTGGTALYQSAALILTPDYTVHFDVVPPVAGSVVSGNTVWVVGRATGASTGYRVTVSADGAQYTLTLATLPSGASASVAMGTIASGFFTVWLLLRGTNITAQVQRSIDRRWLRTDGTWHVDQGTTAAQFADGTYTLPGTIMLGGTWPAPPPLSGLTATSETPLASDPNFPSGYTYQNSLFGGSYQTFDFTNNLYYSAVYGSPNGGIAVTDLTTMHVTRTVTMAQMYAGTAYGSPAGTPFSQDIWDLVCGNSTDLYLLTGSDYVHSRLTRVSPATMKVTGDWFVSASTPPPINCVMGAFGAVNKTASHTIVAYRTNSATGLGPMIFDGSNMAPVGMAATPSYSSSALSLIPGAANADGSCDFLMINWDRAGGSGNIDIWRIHVTDGLAITSTKTGTANILSVFAPGTTLNIGLANYDAAHDAIILMMTNSAGLNGPPVWVVSVNFDGTIRWTQGPLTDVAMVANNRGQSLLTGTTMMIGTGSALKLLNTATGAITFTGSVPSVNSYIFQVYDASRQSYWTYALGTFGYTRIDLPISSVPMLAIDNVIATATTTLLPVNLISLRWSDDRGHSWGHPVSIPIGEAGEYRTSLQWQRLGMARDRVFEIYWDVNMRTALQGCWLDATPAQS